MLTRSQQLLLKNPQFRRYGIFPSGYEYRGPPRFYCSNGGRLLTYDEIGTVSRGAALWPGDRLFALEKQHLEALPDETDGDLVSILDKSSLQYRITAGIGVGFIIFIFTRSPVVAAVASSLTTALIDVRFRNDKSYKIIESWSKK